MTTAHTSPGPVNATTLDALLADAAVRGGPPLLPDMSTARWAVATARRPLPTAQRLVQLGTEAARILVGVADTAPARDDRRFTDAGWSRNPLLKRLMQLYLASGRTLQDLVADADLEARDRERVRFLLENLLEASAPTNVPLVNPASAKAAIETGGLSLLRGGRHLARDMVSAPRVPRMVDDTGFVLGESLAATPGAVVFRNEVFELIQYAPRTAEVAEVPVLVAPPTINKFYAIDLAPDRSLVQFGVEQGRQVFVISWRNPDARHAAWDLDTYVRAIIDALDAVEEITGSARTVLGGLCSGGILASMAAAYLAGIGRQDRLAALALAVTVLDHRGPGTIAAMVDDRTARRAKARSARRGFLDGRTLAEVFAWLRPRDLVWNYWVNNYLLGNDPPAFDILAWNSDTTRMTAGLHADFVDMAITNSLSHPGAAAVLGVPLDLGKITVDTYVVAGVNDHITPWEGCYRSARLLGGRVRFVLSTSGHIAALVNPPGNPKASYRTNDELAGDTEVWLSGAELHAGSWWTDLDGWLDERCGRTVPAPDRLGSARLEVLADAPGTYVLDR